MFFSYSQNNTGGSFDYDEDAGISQWVIIEAEDEDEADVIAESIGLYFDGEGDCECCGNRWSYAYGPGDSLPSIYSTPVWRYYARESKLYIDWMGENPDAYVHYKDGTREAWKMNAGVEVVREGK